MIGRLVAAVLGASLILNAQADEPPVQVMIVGTVHFSNPGRDALNVAMDDVLAPKRQDEIAAIDAGLARFAPTAVAVEWPADIVRERYPQFLHGTLKPSPNEVVQLGFRIAKTMGLAQVYGVDTDGDFPFDAVDAYAKAHGQTAVIDAAWAIAKGSVAATQAAVDTGPLGAVLRLLNDPAHITHDHGFYRTLLRVGAGEEQPGAKLLAAWEARNLSICAKLIQLAKPGDRIVVFFGSGHAYLLRQCISETAGFQLVEANDYLPR